MKRIDWIIVLFLITIGLTCFAMSVMSMMDAAVARAYFNDILKICFWIAMITAGASFFYYVIKRKK